MNTHRTTHRTRGDPQALQRTRLARRLAKEAADLDAEYRAITTTKEIHLWYPETYPHRTKACTSRP